MAYSDKSPPKWGCLIGPAIISPFAFFWLIGNVLSGGGCEGDPDLNCVPDYGSMWFGLAGLGLVGIVVAAIMNRVLGRRFDRTTPDD